MRTAANSVRTSMCRGSVCCNLLWPLLVGAAIVGIRPGGAVAQEITLKDIERLHDQARRQLATTSSRITLHVKVTLEPDAIARERARMMAIAKQVEPAAAKSGLKQNLDVLDAWAASRNLDQHEIYVSDPINQRSRVDTKDLRDLRALDPSRAMGAGEIEGYCKDGVCLQDRKALNGLFRASFSDARKWLDLMLLPTGARTKVDAPVEAGLLDADLWPSFSGTEALKQVDAGGERLVKFTGTTQRGKRIEATLDPQFGYRCRRLEFRTAEGRVVQRLVADDYRNINGILYPFLQQEENYNLGSGKLSDTKTRLIEAVEFGRELTDADFALVLPSGTTVLNGLGGPPSPVQKIDRQYILTLSQLIGLAATNSPSQAESATDAGARSLDVLPRMTAPQRGVH